MFSARAYLGDLIARRVHSERLGCRRRVTLGRGADRIAFTLSGDVAPPSLAGRADALCVLGRMPDRIRRHQRQSTSRAQRASFAQQKPASKRRCSSSSDQRVRHFTGIRTLTPAPDRGGPAPPQQQSSAGLLACNLHGIILWRDVQSACSAGARSVTSVPMPDGRQMYTILRGRSPTRSGRAATLASPRLLSRWQTETPIAFADIMRAIGARLGRGDARPIRQAMWLGALRARLLRVGLQATASSTINQDTAPRYSTRKPANSAAYALPTVRSERDCALAHRQVSGSS